MSARAGTWVLAALIPARSITRALSVDSALGPAVRRLSDVVGQARTCGRGAYHTTLRERATRRWLTGISDGAWCRGD